MLLHKGFLYLLRVDLLRWPLVTEHRPEGLQLLWCVGLIALQHVESSLTRDQTHVPCIGRWILNYWATREVLTLGILRVLVTCLAEFITASTSS